LSRIHFRSQSTTHIELISGRARNILSASLEIAQRGLQALNMSLGAQGHNTLHNTLHLLGATDEVPLQAPHLPAAAEDEAGGPSLPAPVPDPDPLLGHAPPCSRDEGYFTENDLESVLLLVCLGHSLRSSQSLLRTLPGDLLQNHVARHLRALFTQELSERGLLTPRHMITDAACSRAGRRGIENSTDLLLNFSMPPPRVVRAVRVARPVPCFGGKRTALAFPDFNEDQKLDLDASPSPSGSGNWDFLLGTLHVNCPTRIVDSTTSTPLKRRVLRQEPECN
jgi:hypothetical protein